MQVLIDSISREIRGYGILSSAPEGQEILELADEEVPKLTEQGEKHLSLDGVVLVSIPQWSIDDDLAKEAARLEGIAIRNLVVGIAQTAVGVNLTALTAAQVRALMAVLLAKAGGVSADGKVRPLGQWAQ